MRDFEAGIRLEHTSSYIWDLRGNDAGIYVYDETFSFLRITCGGQQSIRPRGRHRRAPRHRRVPLQHRRRRWPRDAPERQWRRDPHRHAHHRRAHLRHRLRGGGAPINLSERIGTLTNELEHAHIYIEELHGKIERLEAETARIDAQEQVIAQLAARLEALAAD
ncbi:MAG: hypothetical protein RIA08_10635 [Roseovarius sp.]|uniref:hypothetical protein n=1 Tax=Roseobacteraceae TaxID=2854170 RepID=UPI0032ED90FF